MKSMQDILSQTVTFILAGGRGARLAPLTSHRSKPAVPFGDRHIVDYTLANCLKSNLVHPFVITQYESAHLTQHVRRWWLRQSTSAENGTAAVPVCIPAPQQEYFGTADALFRNIQALKRNTQYVVVLSADHIYEMDYRELLRFHVDRAADLTLAAIVYPSGSSSQFGILEVDGSARVSGFEEKPVRPKELPGKPGNALANMGIYVFGKDAFLEALRRDAEDATSVHDIGRSIFPGIVKRQNVYAFHFEDSKTGNPGYWKDVGTIDSYYDASMEWLSRLPGTHRLAGLRSVIAEGVRIHRSAEVTDSILMPGVNIGPGARIRRAILDENVQVMTDAQVGYGSEGHSFHRTSNGILVVPSNTVVSAHSNRAAA